MANQRKKSKVHMGGYYEKELKDDLRKIAKQKGISLSELVEQMIQAGLQDYKRRHGEP